MRKLLAITSVLVVALSGCSTSPIERRPTCRMMAAEHAWVDHSLAAWVLVRRTRLHLAEAPPPALVFYDATCMFSRAQGARAFVSGLHNGAVTLPDGQHLPPHVASFAAPYGDGHAFFAMALPPVWAADHVESELGLETLMTAVLVHEMTHTRQFYAFNPRINALTARYHLSADLDDDVVQDTFHTDPVFVADIDAERDLLFRAAAAPSAVEVRDLARQALTHVRARQAQYYVGDNAKFAELEDVFLTMEGIGQWSAYSWIIHPQGADVDPARALPLFRRGGRYWSQDEGLALFLVIDRLAPDWQARAFAPQPDTALHMLETVVS